MNLVVDGNIIISCLIKDSKTAEIFVNPLIKLYSPSFIIEEIEKYAQEIIVKTYRKDITDLIIDILSLVRISQKAEFEDFIETAKQISPDPKDALYLALALKLNCPIWSNDKELKKQNLIKIFSTEELEKKIFQ